MLKTPFCVMFLAFSAALAAGPYEEGLAAMKKKNYGDALKLFKAALLENPDQYKAYRYIGDCYYYSGDKERALKAYDHYLEDNPDEDEDMQDFADELREKLRLEEEEKRAEEEARNTKPRIWSFGVEGAFNSYSMNDWNTQAALNTSSLYNFGGAIYNGVGGGASLRYYYAEQWGAGVFLDYLPAVGSSGMNITYGSSVYASAVNYNLSALLLGPQLLFRSSSKGRGSFNFGASAGYMMLVGASAREEASVNMSYYGSGSASGVSMSDDYSGSGYGGKLFIGGEWFLGQSVSLLLRLGYRFAQIPSVNGKAGTLLRWDGNPVPLDYSGMMATMGMAFWP